MRLSEDQAKHLVAEIHNLEKIARALEDIFLSESGSGEVPFLGRSLTMENLEEFLSVSTAFYSRASRLWGIAKSAQILAASDKDLIESDYYARARKIYKDTEGGSSKTKNKSDLTEKDAKTWATLSSSNAMESLVEWEQITARSFAVKTSLEAIMETANKIGWMRSKEWSATR